MTRARNISFYKLMTAGYISADTYRALLPKQRFYELSFSDCYEFKNEHKDELMRLFEDEQIIQSIACLEKLEENILSGISAPFAILDECLTISEDNAIWVVNTVGRRAFLLDYVYCTDISLSTRSYIDKENINQVSDLIRRFREIYQSKLQKPENVLDLSAQHLEMLNNNYGKSSSEPKANKENIKSGDGFKSEDKILIDDDSLSVSNAEYKKYILYLYSLDKIQLQPIIDYTKSVISQISIRALNGIRSIGLRNFLVNYLFADESKLLNIRNFGKKSLYDLDRIKPVIIDYISDSYINGNTTEIEETIEQESHVRLMESRTIKERIGDKRYFLLIKELEKLTNGLSVRSRNGILNYHGEFIEDFINKNMNIRNLRNIGKKSESELLLVISKLKEFVKTMETQEISAEEIDIYEKRSFYKDCFDEYALDFYDETGHLPMFYISERLIRNNVEKRRDFQIFNLHTPFFKDLDYYTLEEIAIEKDLTRERVRQIYKKLNKQLHSISVNSDEAQEYSVERIISRREDWQYIRDIVLPMDYFEISQIESISVSEKNNLTDDFAFFILCCIVEDSFSLIGRDPIASQSKSKQKWNNSYLVKNVFVEKFDFESIFEIIEDYEGSYTEDLTATVQDLLLDFFFTAWKEFDANLVERLSSIISTILIKEFGLIPDENLCFTIEGKKEEIVEDVLYDILLENGNPLTLDELYLAVDNKFPGRYKSPASIRMYVIRDPRLCSVGTNNLVGLLEWDHIKIGSIRNIIIQYLNNYDEPQHITQIAKHVQRYRDTSEKNIRSTMISGDQFIQFGGGLYGIKGKHYAKIFYTDDFEQRVQELETFLQVNERFPFMPSNPSEESLYRWWKRYMNSSKLNERQKSEIERIKSSYFMLPTSKKNLEWFDLCQKFQVFVKKYGRRPSPYSFEEKSLHAWLDKAMNDFTDGKLNPQQEKAFLDLCKSL